MANTREAIENVKSLARTFQSVIDLAATLEGLANVEQALAETQSRMHKLADEAARAEAARDVAKGDAALTLEHANQVKAIAEQDADRVLNEARKQADAILATGKLGADNLLAEARKQAEELRCAAKDLQDQRDAAAQELADLEAKIERARAKMRDILGA